MATASIRLYGDPVLRLQAEAVGEIDGESRALVRDMIETVDHAGGLGLAAPQIGVSARVIVVVEIDEEGRRTPHALINPDIVSACGEDVGEEGCLSVPGIYAKVKRPQSVVVHGFDAEGKRVEIEATGIMARAFAHEIDHLDGILFVDRIGLVKRSLLKKKLTEIKKQAKEMLNSPL